MASVPTPKVVGGAQFSNSMSRLTLTFDSSTNEYAAGTCLLFTNATIATFGTSPRCTWDNPRVMTIELDADFSLEPSHSITIEAGVLMSAGDYSDPLDSTELVVLTPVSPPLAVATITGAEAVGSCSELLLAGGASSGGAGRPLAYEWEVVRSTYLTNLVPSEYDKIDSFFAQHSDAALVVPSDVLPDGRKYQVRLTVTNWLGRSDAAEVISMIVNEV